MLMDQSHMIKNVRESSLDDSLRIDLQQVPIDYYGENE